MFFHKQVVFCKEIVKKSKLFEEIDKGSYFFVDMTGTNVPVGSGTSVRGYNYTRWAGCFCTQANLHSPASS